MNSKLVIGSAQFGLNYGINNKDGQVRVEDVRKILATALDNQVDIIDTSSAYGNSEEVIGSVIKANDNFKIISKYPKSDISVADSLQLSLNRLRQSSLYGYLVHHFDFYLGHPGIWNEFIEAKKCGKVQKIGFSIYSPSQLEILLNNNVPFDLIQFPYNIFDRQFDPYLDELKLKGVEIHTRSAFLQGLFFKDKEALPIKLEPLSPYLRTLREYCSQKKITIEQLALNYVCNNKKIDGVLVGVDNTSQLLSNINVIDAGISTDDKEFVQSINVKEKQLLNPVNWN